MEKQIFLGPLAAKVIWENILATLDLARSVTITMINNTNRPMKTILVNSG